MPVCFVFFAVLRLLVCLSVQVACLVVEMQFIFTGSTRQKIAVRERDVFIIHRVSIKTVSTYFLLQYDMI